MLEVIREAERAEAGLGVKMWDVLKEADV